MSMQRFAAIAARHFKLSEGEIVDSLTARDVPEWDSMNYLLFIADLEKEFQVSFTMEEVLSAESLGSVRKALQSKGVTV